MIRKDTANVWTLLVDRADRLPVLPLELRAVAVLVLAQFSKERLEPLLPERMLSPKRHRATLPAKAIAGSGSLQLRDGQHFQCFVRHR